MGESDGVIGSHQSQKKESDGVISSHRMKTYGIQVVALVLYKTYDVQVAALALYKNAERLGPAIR